MKNMNDRYKGPLITILLMLGGWVCLYMALFMCGRLNVSFNTLPLLIIFPILLWMGVVSFVGSACLNLGRLRIIGALVIAVICINSLKWGIMGAYFTGFRVYVEKCVSLDELQAWAISKLAQDQVDPFEIIDPVSNGPGVRRLPVSEFPSFLDKLLAEKPSIGLVDASLTGASCVAIHWPYSQGVLIAGPEFKNQWTSHAITFRERSSGIYLYVGVRP
ncbi:hypothetical protein P3T73_15230 [Kiritimatiellota bacterium B12222]|nr:hypothetical protein P3T73_15230 [Kiritimatiellota bacterium B12222]